MYAWVVHSIATIALRSEMHRAVLQSCIRVPTFLVLVLGSNCLDISQWIYAHLSPDPLCLLSRDTEFTRWCQEDGSVKEHLAEVTTPRLRIRRLAKVTQVKSSCRGVNYISAARKARTGNKASSSSQWTRNGSNITRDFMNFLREKPSAAHDDDGTLFTDEPILRRENTW
jgi:hypothetical protein